MMAATSVAAAHTAAHGSLASSAPLPAPHASPTSPSRGMGLTKRALFRALGVGSVTDYVARHAHCSLAVHKA